MVPVAREVSKFNAPSAGSLRFRAPGRHMGSARGRRWPATEWVEGAPRSDCSHAELCGENRRHGKAEGEQHPPKYLRSWSDRLPGKKGKNPQKGFPGLKGKNPQKVLPTPSGRAPLMDRTKQGKRHSPIPNVDQGNEKAGWTSQSPKVGRDSKRTGWFSQICNDGRDKKKAGNVAKKKDKGRARLGKKAKEKFGEQHPRPKRGPTEGNWEAQNDPREQTKNVKSRRLRTPSHNSGNVRRKMR